MNNPLKEIINASVFSTKPYSPGKYVEGLSQQGIIKLASNENPLGPSKKTIEAINNALTDLCRYPDFNGNQLKTTLSNHLDVLPEQITLSNGSNETLLLISQLFLNEKCEAIIPEYSFALYEIATNLMKAKPIITRTNHWQIDLDAIFDALTKKTRLIFLANPNNPTGILIDKNELASFIKRIPDNIIIIVDEAYHEYASLNQSYASMMPLLKNHPNLIITRSFSKAYALAGLRLGYSISTSYYIAEMINRIRATFNVNQLALVAGVASLNDKEFLNETLALYQQEYERLKNGLDRLGIEHLPSAGNFVTINLQKPAHPIFERLQKEGVIVRPLDSYNMANYLRVTIGLPSENERFLMALKNILD